jgi:signal transduction histidine kinase
VESAAVLTALYGRFIEVWRQKEAIVQRNRMTRLLIRNAGHEVRTPLNSIVNYLEVALEEELDERAKSHLQRSLQASKSLVVVVNDLLHLTEAEDTDFQVYEDNVNLRSLVSEVVAAFSDEALRRELHITIGDHEAIPQLVRCDPSGLRQVISNLLSNSLQHSSHGHINVELQHIQTTQANVTIKIAFTDHGTGLSEEQLDSIFRDFEQILDDDESPVQEQNVKGSGTGPLQIGLGLATVAKFVRLHSGQIIMASEGKGKGTQVSIIIPFRKALTDDFPRQRPSSDIVLPTPPADTTPRESETPGSASSSSTQPPNDSATTSSSSPGQNQGPALSSTQPSLSLGSGGE